MDRPLGRIRQILLQGRPKQTLPQGLLHPVRPQGVEQQQTVRAGLPLQLSDGRLHSRSSLPVQPGAVELTVQIASDKIVGAGIAQIYTDPLYRGERPKIGVTRHQFTKHGCPINKT